MAKAFRYQAPDRRVEAPTMSRIAFYANEYVARPNLSEETINEFIGELAKFAYKNPDAKFSDKVKIDLIQLDAKYNLLNLTARRGNFSAAALWCDLGINPNLPRGEDAQTPGHEAAGHNHPLTIKSLFKKGAELRGKNAVELTPAGLAVIKKHHGVVEEIGRLADHLLHEWNEADGTNFLHVAAAGGDEKTCDVLVKVEVDLTARDSKYHRTPSEWARVQGFEKLAKRLEF
jgi:ankyrin repeat protein